MKSAMLLEEHTFQFLKELGRYKRRITPFIRLESLLISKLRDI